MGDRPRLDSTALMHRIELGRSRVSSYTRHDSLSHSWQRQQRRKKTVIKHYNEVQQPKVKRDSNDSMNDHDNDNDEETVEINSKAMAVRSMTP